MGEQLGTLTSGLIELNLRGTGATDAALASLLASSPDLQLLDVSECQKLTDFSCIATLVDLRELRAGNCFNMQSNTVASLRNCKRLSLLDVSFCPQVDDECLKLLASGAVALLHLELAGNQKVGDEGLLAVCLANPSIGHLTLTLNVRCSDDAVAKSVKPLKRLSFLDVAGCKNISSRTCSALSRNCECLVTLNLASTGVNAAGVGMVVSKCIALQQLDISSCDITDEGFVGAMQINHHIKKVKITHLPYLTDETINRIRAEHPNCTFEREAKKMTDPKDPNYLVTLLGEQYVAKAKPQKAKKKGEGDGKKGQKKKGKAR